MHNNPDTRLCTEKSEILVKLGLHFSMAMFSGTQAMSSLYRRGVRSPVYHPSLLSLTLSSALMDIAPASST